MTACIPTADSYTSATDADLYGPDVPTTDDDGLYGPPEVPNTAECCTEGTMLLRTDFTSLASKLTLKPDTGAGTEAKQKKKLRNDNMPIFGKVSPNEAATNSASKQEIDLMKYVVVFCSIM